MTTTQNFFFYAGVVLVLSISLFLLCGIIIIISDAIENKNEKIRQKMYLKACKDIGAQLKSGAYWFTSKEYTPVFNMLMIAGEDLVKYQKFTVSDIRSQVMELGSKKVTQLDNQLNKQS